MSNELPKEFFSELAELKKQEKALKENIRMRVVTLIEYMTVKNIEKVDADFAKFRLVDYERFTYPKEIVEAEADLKVKKLDAIRTGEATCETSKVLKIYPTKDDDE